ncbi:hypothetical protein ACHAXR_010371 [Thalassiosira sp. AJA248-18]
MEGEDASTILESSLFFSCMSSATASDEHDGGEGKAKVADSVPSSDHVGRGKDTERPQMSDEEHNVIPSIDARASNPTDAKGSNIASNPSSSNSSWSVLSEKERPLVRSITFNRDRTCLIVSTTTGVRIRMLESLHLSLENLDGGDNNNTQSSWIHDVPLPPDGATYAQLLHSTSLLAVVKPSSPRCCFLYNAKDASSPLAALPLSAAVKRVELQRRVLAAMTVDLRLHVFHMTDSDGGSDVQQNNGNGDSEGVTEKKSLRPTLITTLNIFHPSDSPRNVTRGLNGFNAGSYFDLSTHEDAPYLVCKSFNGKPGTVRVYDPTTIHNLANVASCNASIGSGSAVSTTSSWDKYNSPPASKKNRRRLHLLTTINAHDHSVTRMVIGGGGNEQQTFLATVSSKGTTIRVFGLPTGDHLWSWHRGSRPCQFHSLSWNAAADRLASYGSSGTIHIFDWQKKKQPAEMSESLECDDAHDDRDFEKVDDDAGPRAFDKTMTQNSKPLLRRIGSSIKRRATGSSNASPSKHRSMAKMKYKPSALPSTAASTGSNAKSTRPPSLVFALLDRNHGEDRKNGRGAEKEETLVLCSTEGECELRQYSVMSDGSIGLIQIEDVLSRR